MSNHSRFSKPMRTFLSLAVWSLAVLAMGAADSSQDTLRLRHRPVEPTAQALELDLDPAAEAYSGKVAIDLVVHTKTSVIRLHAQDLDLGAATLTPRSGGESTVLKAERGEIGLLTLTAPADLAPGAYRLELGFSGRYRRDGMGLYKTEHEENAYLFTQFEARFARTAFPCWDEPDFKIPWQVTISVPDDGVTVYSNSGVVLESREGGRRRIAFARTPPMPSYLVALAAGALEATSVSGMSVPGRIITARGQLGLAATFARETPVIFTALEDYFGSPYPYGKLDQVAVPEFVFGGMENAGLITYRDELVLLPPGDQDLAARRHLVLVVAHEIAHHWFGNLVTMEWWNDLWLNESFASWMETKILNRAYPELRYDLFAARGKQRVMRIDALPSTGPVRREITARDDPEKFVDDLSYEKGQAVLTMIESWIGPEAFRQAMRGYFARHRWGNARAEDLWSAFGNSSGSDIPAIVASFIEQPGVPLVSIEVIDEDRVRLRQQRYVAQGSPPASGAASQSWLVPMIFRYASASGVKTQRVLLSSREQTVEMPGIGSAAWILPNGDETGYYRWALPSAVQSRLVSEGLSELTPLERYGVLENAAALHDAGEIPADQYLGLLVQFLHDPVAELADLAVSSLERVRNVYLGDGDAAAYAAFCRATLRPALDRIGMEPAPDEPPERAAFRRDLIEVLGIRGSDPDVVAFAQTTAGRALKDPTSIDSRLFSAVIRVAAWHGGRSFFEACRRAIETTTVPKYRSVLIEALGGSQDPALWNEALSLSLDASVRMHEPLVIAFAVAEGSDAGRARAVEWVRQNFPAIRARNAEYSVNQLIRLADSTDRELFAGAREYLLAPERVQDGAEKEIAEVADRVAQKIALRMRGREAVLGFLRERAGT